MVKNFQLHILVLARTKNEWKIKFLINISRWFRGILSFSFTLPLLYLYFFLKFLTMVFLYKAATIATIICYEIFFFGLKNVDNKGKFSLMVFEDICVPFFFHYLILIYENLCSPQNGWVGKEIKFMHILVSFSKSLFLIFFLFDDNFQIRWHGGLLLINCKFEGLVGMVNGVWSICWAFSKAVCMEF